MVKKSCKPTPVYRQILDVAENHANYKRQMLMHVQQFSKHPEGAASRNVSCCIACINWIRRMENICKNIQEVNDISEDENTYNASDRHTELDCEDNPESNKGKRRRSSSISRTQGSQSPPAKRVYRGKAKNTLVIPMDHLLLFLSDPGDPILGNKSPDRR